MDFPDKSVGEAKPKEKRVKAAVVDGAVPVKRPATRRFLDFLFAESPKAVGKKIGNDVIVPRVKQGLEEALNSFISGMFWGGSRPPGLTGSALRGGGTAYSSISTGGSLLAARQAVEPTKHVAYEDFAFQSQQQAELVLANMFELLNQYRVVAIGDLNDLLGNSSQPTDNAYGWTSLEGSRISKDRNGFRLELPRPVLIN